MRKGLQKQLEWKHNFEFVKLLREQMTLDEQILWKVLRGRRSRGLKFRRQVRIGPYIADFLCKEHWLIVEVDGEIHQQRRPYDRERDVFLRSCGYRVLQVTNRSIKNDLPQVLDRIWMACRFSPTNNTHIQLPSPANRRGAGR